MTHTQTVMLRLLTMCIPFRNLRKKWRTFLRDFLSDYDRDARRSMRAWRRHPVAGRTILILEPNYCHGEVIPGFCRHLLDMGYRVDVLMHHSLARQSPLCCFKEGDIHIFTSMCTSWKRLAKARVLTRYEAILVSTSAFYDIPGWASFLHMTGLDKFANLLAVEHELKDIPRFGEEELDRQGRLLTLGSFPRGMMVNPHFFGEIPPAPPSMLLEVQDRQKENVPAEVFQKRNRHAPNPRIHSLFCKEVPPIIPVTAVFPVFIYSYQQHDHLLPGNDRMLVIGSSALAKNHGHLKSSRLAADTLIFNFPLNHPRLWRQMEHSLSGARYSIILFMWPPLHLSPANGRLMEKPPEGGGPMESAEDMLCRLFAFLRKQTRRLILLSSPPSDYGSARHPYAEEPGLLEAWNTLLRTLADRQNLPFIDFCGDMLQCRSLPGSGEEDFPEAYRNLGKQVLRRLPFGQTWVKRRSGKIHRLLEKRRKRWKERMLARWRTLAAPPHYREETDWITAIHSEKGQARILLIGDSVMRHLWRPLASELQEDIDLFSSTLIPGDPDYLPALAGYFPSAGYEAIIFSFGSHVTNKVSAISVDDFRKNYMAFVSQLSKRCRFLILATSTSIMDGPDGTLNEEKEKPLAAFNAIVREAASALPGAVLSDHHGFMQGARYIDPFHFSPPDRAYQAGKTAGLLLPLLAARQEPPTEQERPKSRPEP